MKHHPAPLWFRFLSWLFPSRCREIPEATDPGRILLRQFAIIPRVCYLQQFASGENPDFYHRHEFARAHALVLSGSYTESRPGQQPRRVHAPAYYSMDRSVRHRVTDPSARHTSIFFGWKRVGERGYFHRYALSTEIPWQKHVKQQVKRI